MIAATISIGSTIGSTTVDISDDAILERTETFTVTIVSGLSSDYLIVAGATSLLTVSILDSPCKYTTMYVMKFANIEMAPSKLDQATCINSAGNLSAFWLPGL